MGQNAIPTEEKAAHELQNYLKEISGTSTPINTDSTAEKEFEILIGK